MRRLLYVWLLCCMLTVGVQAQPGLVSGKVWAMGKAVDKAAIQLNHSAFTALTDSNGVFVWPAVPAGNYVLTVAALGFEPLRQKIVIKPGENNTLNLSLHPTINPLQDVVVTGTLKEVRRSESPVPVEVFTPLYFRKNPTPNIFDALQNVNGVRPQLNCNICNTGDIHINGLEGPYTMVLIDGMPIVSSLSTVYGLSGIPNSLVERVEIIKGPASSLYGSEAVGGLINIITKQTAHAARLSADIMYTSWKEWNTDLGFTHQLGKKLIGLTGINYYHYQHPVDNNQDGFTDVTLQKRISIFQKWTMHRKMNRVASIAARYYHEDRWGGDIRWNKSFRGGDSIYGESIDTKRWELTSHYQLPVKEKMVLSVSYNDHQQDSRYGVISYIARQQIAFAQLTWDKKMGRHDLLAGGALRYTYYDDNTPATAGGDSLRVNNQPQKTWLPGLFVQDEIHLNEQQQLLLGFRYDHNSIHGAIFTPRLAFKWKLQEKHIVRLNAGTGFRVVNLFTEDHAALTGARKVVIKNELKPERTYNVNLNYLFKTLTNNGTIVALDITGWYTYFNNRIIGDYDTDPNQIIYDNLQGHAVSKGISMNLDLGFLNGIKTMLGITYQDVSKTENGIREQQVLTEKITGTWSLSYTIQKWNLGLDYTGNLYGPMRLPLLGPLDPRNPNAPWWSIQNIQLVYRGLRKVEWYGGVKNLLNWTPTKGNPFLIARTHDPFDKQVQYDANGKIMATPENPYALSFDPTYVYAPNQGIRLFMGIRVNLQ